MATPDQKSPNVLLQNLCCRILGRSEADVAQQFQFAVRVIGSNFAPTVERDEFLVAEKIKKELIRQRREADAALFSELHRKLHSQGVLKNKWSILYLLLNLSEDPRKQASKVTSYASLFAQALPRDAHSTPYYCARPQTLPLNYQDRSTQSSGSLGSSGISSIGMCGLSGPTPVQPFLPGQSHQAPGVGDGLRQQLGPRLAWTLTGNQPSQTPTSKAFPNALSRNLTRSRREGDPGGTSEVTEAALVRDILYVFQGIDGKNIKMSSTENCYKVEAKANLSKSLRDTAVRLAELGWLHNKIRKYADQRSLDRSFGLVGQSFCAALHQELKEYYRLLSVLHSQLQLEDDQGVNVGLESSLTLRRLLVWTYDPKIRLKTLAALVDHCQGRKGGELASAVHAYTKTGDPYMKSLVQHILSLVSHPVLSFLYRWIYDGELEDTYHEFFVASDPTVKTDRLWHDKYTLRKSMIPSFITMDQSRKVLLIGKSINFLHQVCHDQTPTTKMIAVTKSAESPRDAADLFTDLENAFQGKIDAAYFETSKYLLDVLNRKYSLLEHMQAMRRYLLLGQGDFIRHLMDLLKSLLVTLGGMSSAWITTSTDQLPLCSHESA
ncbi:tubulin, gamma complex associated protein 3 [Rattus norvegicus]|uniref:Tubulin, gamma complex associated protein 3 n=1 Tax=Rattus norvegicus TaxID=10116 RepID=A6IWL9_RAT|nr:tubulin, gamma complex associated protein 3 [Rattus norvegicus]|eukprot:NP_001100793.1 gamma-tubulin complex component 3 [Rattus norvegicus]